MDLKKRAFINTVLYGHIVIKVCNKLCQTEFFFITSDVN